MEVARCTTLKLVLLTVCAIVNGCATKGDIFKSMSDLKLMGAMCETQCANNGSLLAFGFHKVVGHYCQCMDSTTFVQNPPDQSSSL